VRASIFAIASCFALLAPVGASAQETQPVPAMQQTSDGTNSEKLVCRYSYYEGTVIRRKECHKQADWDRMRFQAQKEVTDFQMRSLTVNTPK
jgi:hypothetical protein